MESPSESNTREATPEGRLVADILLSWRRNGAWPPVEALRLEHVEARETLDALLDMGLLRVHSEHCRPSLGALLRFGPEAELAGFDRLLPSLKDAWRRNRAQAWSAEELGALSGLPTAEVAQVLELFASELDIADALFGDDAGLVGAIQLSPVVMELEPFAAVRARLGAQGPLAPPLRLTGLRVDGYRALEGFEARFGALTVLSGAQGSGKSSLLDCLALLSFAAAHPLPPGLDPRGTGQRLFHAGAPERIHLSLCVTSGTGRSLRYAVSLGGPLEAPRVTSERLASVERDASGRESEPFTFLDFKGGKGTVRTVMWEPPRPRVLPVPRTVPPDELALRGELDPALRVVASFREFLSGWRCHPGFEVGRGSAVRRPVPSEPEPLLALDGSNLSAVLFHLMVEHPERWRELEAHLRSAIPSFHSLSVKPRGGPGTVIGVWREAGVRDELTLADLSDGTLRFLCLAALCLSPRKPPLVGLDGPEVGLHPRVLPVLAGLLRRASTETQVLVATGSSELLAEFSGGEMALLEKVDGRVVFAGVDGAVPARAM
ncbi:AAA family ATPase [Archangium violaceum]|uniref:AAA family ATPase n=1 Tax=Archangium violaceum TaxID=83451 RepID=UPI00194E6902|nr:AAA family ATPase [Archangium violaceum]QRN96866.1 AAA family ATPase [Archangium violaceum]